MSNPKNEPPKSPTNTPITGKLSEHSLPQAPAIPDIGTSEYLQNLTDAINTAISRTSSDTISNLTKPDPKGAVNTVFKGTLGSREVIVRVARGSFGTFQKEQMSTKTALAEPQPINTPAVLHIGEIKEFGLNHPTYPDAFHISAFIEGKDLDDKALSLPEKIAAWKKVGTVAAALHTKKVEDFGERLFDTPQHSRSGAHSSSSWTDDIKKSLGLDSPPSRPLPTTLHRHREKIEEALALIEGYNIAPVLCHGNIQGNNVRVTPTGDISLLDWGSATGHSPLLDIAELYAFPPSRDNPEEAHELRKAFYGGYGESTTPQENKLLSAFIIVRLAQGAGYMQDKLESEVVAENVASRIGDIPWP